MTAKIFPLHLGILKGSFQPVHTYMNGFGKTIDVPCIAYYIQAKTARIIVDGGPGDPEINKERQDRELICTPEQTYLGNLERLGVAPEDVDIVVATHLHWDHVTSFGLFPNAPIYVQRRELEIASAPPPVFAHTYESELVNMVPRWVPFKPQMKLIEGDHDLVEGVKLIFSPGHTPGIMGILVSAESGPVFIASDIIPRYDNWNWRAGGERIPPGIHVNIEDCYKSFRRIERLADIVLPGHDPAVFQREYY